MRRGDIRWYMYAAPDKRRPVLLLTRVDVIDALNEIIVVPATRTIRGLATKVLLSTDDGGELRAQLRSHWPGATQPPGREPHDDAGAAVA